MLDVPSVAPLVVALDHVDLDSIDLVGAKAARLGWLRRRGFPVPDGFVISTEAQRLAPDAREVVTAAIREALSALRAESVAVRSSGIAEDRDDASWAGQYESILDVRGADAVLRAVERCWASANAPRVDAYAREHNVTVDRRLAVLIQIYVPADAAGVAFSANPISGARDEVLVSAIEGIGEALVSGTSTAEEWCVRAGRATCTRATELRMAEADVRLLAEQVLRIAQLAGRPQDVEWCIREGRFSFLQTRPITRLPVPVTWESPLPGTWVRDWRIGEWLGGPVSPLFESWLLPILEDAVADHFQSRWGIRPVQPMHVVVNGWYFASTGVRLPSPGEQWLRYRLPKLLRAPWSLVGLGVATTMDRHWRRRRSEYLAAIGSAERALAGQGASIAEAVDVVARDAGRTLALLVVASRNAELAEQRLVSASQGVADVRRFLSMPSERDREDGHLATSLDWAHPTLGELPAAPPVAPLAPEPVPAELPRALRRRIAQARLHAAIKDRIAFGLTLGWPVMRRCVLRLGHILVSSGRLVKPEDVFLLQRAELTTGITPEEIERRRDRRRSSESMCPPLRLGPAEPAPPGGEDREVRGAPASAGQATGTVRIVRSPADFDRLRRGDVLVAPFTTPGWTVLFDRAVAVVTDGGSLASHASIVAREYGLPSVVGTGDATRRLSDGERVHVDGTAGIVRRIIPAPGTS